MRLNISLSFEKALQYRSSLIGLQHHVFNDEEAKVETKQNLHVLGFLPGLTSSIHAKLVRV